MAYVLPQDDEEEQQKQQEAQTPSTPKLGGSQSFGGASGGGGMAPAIETPKAQNAQSKGSGFTNLSNWLDAGKGRDQSITSKSTGLLGTEKDTFNKALEPVKSADFKAKNVVDAGSADPEKGNLGINQFENTFNSAAGGDANAKTEVTGMLNQKYDGPRDVNYDATKQKNLWDTASLTSADTAGQVLARPQIEAGQYGAGMQRLDSALFGADSASRGAMDTAKKDLTSFGDTVKTDTKAMMDKVAGFDAAAKSGNDSTKKALEKIGANMSGSIDSRVAEARAKEEEARKALADGYIETEDGYRKAGNGYSAGAITGGGATRDNIATAQERSGFDLLNELIGTEKLQQSGPYQSVKAETVFDPNWKPEQAESTEPVSPEMYDDFVSRANELFRKSQGGMNGIGDMLGSMNFTDFVTKARNISPEDRYFMANKLRESMKESMANQPKAVQDKWNRFIDALAIGRDGVEGNDKEEQAQWEKTLLNSFRG